jgi:Leucine-rich repeat (LRR) protein
LKIKKIIRWIENNLYSLMLSKKLVKSEEILFEKLSSTLGISLQLYPKANTPFIKIVDGKIAVISLAGLKLTQIPNEIFQMRFLKSLNLSNNQIEEVSDEIGNLINIKRLNLGYNKLSKLPKTIGVNRF